MNDFVVGTRRGRRQRWAGLMGAALVLASCGGSASDGSDLSAGSASVSVPATSSGSDGSATPTSDASTTTTSEPASAPSTDTATDDLAPEVLGGDCSFDYTIGGTRVVGQDGDVVTWSNSAERESRLLVGEPTGEAYGGQLTFTTASGVRSEGEGVTAAGEYFVRFADFKAARDTPLGSSVSNTGDAVITTYEDGVAVAGTASGTLIARGGDVERLDFSIEFSVFDSGEHNFGAADFECYIGGPPTADS